ncbi:MAG: aminodeoxychorismate lyase [Desulfobacterales bacterium]|nr:MAG: aminodeoxychorismate lyase [Desulfobacterales bacterium]
MKKILYSCLVCVLLALLLGMAGAILYDRAQHFLTFAPDSQASPVVFVVFPGQSLKTIANDLEKEHLVTNGTWFRLYARYKGVAKKIKAGEYEMSGALTPVQILDILVQGKERLIALSFPEGFTMDQLALRVEAQGFCSARKFSALCRNPAFIKKMKVPSHSLEGFLFPDTYFFPVHAKCTDILEKMVSTFFRHIPAAWESRARALGFSLQEIITLASMIEKETAAPEERPLIASVFHNRLKKRMRLESDPTVVYGLSDFSGRIRKKHLRNPTPYNTYQIRGLPKGPIANPGLLSIKAALYPASASYLYFVSKNDRTHHFSKTLAEHNRAVYVYQIKKKVGGEL